MNKTTYEEELEKHGRLVFTNEGTSMLPLLREKRDLMVIERRPPERCKKYDAVLFKRDDKYVMHRILKVRKNDYVICGDHQFRREFGVRDEQILGVLTAVVRDGKTLYAADWKYRLYVHLWCDFFYLRAGILFVFALPRLVKRRIRNHRNA